MKRLTNSSVTFDTIDFALQEYLYRVRRVILRLVKGLIYFYRRPPLRFEVCGSDLLCRFAADLLMFERPQTDSTIKKWAGTKRKLLIKPQTHWEEQEPGTAGRSLISTSKVLGWMSSRAGALCSCSVPHATRLATNLLLASCSLTATCNL